MKNEKVCFNKNVGIILFIGITVIFGILLLGQLSLRSTSINTRAYFEIMPTITPTITNIKPEKDLSKKNPSFQKCQGDNINLFLNSSVTKAQCKDFSELKFKLIIGSEFNSSSPFYFNYSKQNNSSTIDILPTKRSDEDRGIEREFNGRLAIPQGNHKIQLHSNAAYFDSLEIKISPDCTTDDLLKCEWTYIDSKKDFIVTKDNTEASFPWIWNSYSKYKYDIQAIDDENLERQPERKLVAHIKAIIGRHIIRETLIIPLWIARDDFFNK